MRSHVTSKKRRWRQSRSCFNTASGMRSHVTPVAESTGTAPRDVSIPQAVWGHMWLAILCTFPQAWLVSIPQAVWGHMWRENLMTREALVRRFNTASGMRSHVTILPFMEMGDSCGVSIPQAVWGHMWLRMSSFGRQFLIVSIPQAVWGHMWRQGFCW